ncbi:MAG: hypothetical protein IJV43_07470, partial [Oscillospiraceae bacterium]|nr:hypothetical protein [Oscillospiraceae bacterium]
LQRERWEYRHDANYVSPQEALSGFFACHISANDVLYRCGDVFSAAESRRGRSALVCGPHLTKRGGRIIIEAEEKRCLERRDKSAAPAKGEGDV